MIFLFSVLTLTFFQLHHVECNTGWYRFQDWCYKVTTGEHYFMDAVKRCQSMKASLVTIYTEAENQFVSRLVKESSTYGEVWIGLVKSTTRDSTKNQQQKRSPSLLKAPTFVWIDGTKLSYEHWMLNRPLSGSGDCGQMITGGHWNNVNCYNRFSFICKKGMY